MNLVGFWAPGTRLSTEYVASTHTRVVLFTSLVYTCTLLLWWHCLYLAVTVTVLSYDLALRLNVKLGGKINVLGLVSAANHDTILHIPR